MSRITVPYANETSDLSLDYILAATRTIDNYCAIHTLVPSPRVFSFTAHPGIVNYRQIMPIREMINSNYTHDGQFIQANVDRSVRLNETVISGYGVVEHKEFLSEGVNSSQKTGFGTGVVGDVILVDTELMYYDTTTTVVRGVGLTVGASHNSGASIRKVIPDKLLSIAARRVAGRWQLLDNQPAKNKIELLDEMLRMALADYRRPETLLLNNYDIGIAGSVETGSTPNTVVPGQITTSELYSLMKPMIVEGNNINIRKNDDGYTFTFNGQAGGGQTLTTYTKSLTVSGTQVSVVNVVNGVEQSATTFSIANTQRSAGTGLTLNGNTLSVTNPFTEADESHLDGIEEDAEKNVHTIEGSYVANASADEAAEYTPYTDRDATTVASFSTFSWNDVKRIKIWNAGSDIDPHSPSSDSDAVNMNDFFNRVVKEGLFEVKAEFYNDDFSLDTSKSAVLVLEPISYSNNLLDAYVYLVSDDIQPKNAPSYKLSFRTPSRHIPLAGLEEVIDIPDQLSDAQIGEKAFKNVPTDLTDNEKSNARTRIGAGTSDFDGAYNSLTGKPDLSKHVQQDDIVPFIPDDVLDVNWKGSLGIGYKDAVISSGNTPPSGQPNGITDAVVVEWPISSTDETTRRATLAKYLNTNPIFRAKLDNKFVIARAALVEENSTAKSTYFWFNPDTDENETLAYDQLGTGSGSFEIMKAIPTLAELRNDLPTGVSPAITGTTKLMLNDFGEVSITHVSEHIKPTTTKPVTLTQTYETDTLGNTDFGKWRISNALSNGAMQIEWVIPATISDLSRADIVAYFTLHHQIKIYEGAKVIKGTLTGYAENGNIYTVNIGRVALAGGPADATQVGTPTDGEVFTFELQSNLIGRDELTSSSYKSNAGSTAGRVPITNGSNDAPFVAMRQTVRDSAEASHNVMPTEAAVRLVVDSLAVTGAQEGSDVTVSKASWTTIMSSVNTTDTSLYIVNVWNNGRSGNVKMAISVPVIMGMLSTDTANPTSFPVGSSGSRIDLAINGTNLQTRTDGTDISGNSRARVYKIGI